MRTVALALSLLVPLVAACGRTPETVPSRDGWHVVDYPAGGSRRVGRFDVERASITPLRAYAAARDGWYDFHPALVIEPRDGPVRGAVAIRAGYYVGGDGSDVLLEVSFDGGPAERVLFRRDESELRTSRAFADRLARHRTVTIALPGWDRYHPPGVLTYELGGLAPQLAALDAELHARRAGAGLVSRLL